MTATTTEIVDPPLAPPRLLNPSWSLWLLTFGMPAAYFLGFSALVWVIPAFALGAPLVLRKSVRFPTALLPLFALVLWVPITATRLESAGSAPMFTYRWLLWVAALVVALWLCNTSTRSLSTERVVGMLAALWIALVAFGYLAVLLPSFEAPSLVQQVLRPLAGGNKAFRDVTNIRFATVQTYAEGAVPRPAAPFPWSNGWGAALALLTPFFVVAWLTVGSARRRFWGWMLVAAALVPVAISTNRGMWLSLAIALAYYAVRRALNGDARPLLVVLTLAVLLPSLVLVTPLKHVVFARLDSTQDSNTVRENIYREGFDESLKAPLLGYGAPKTDELTGTHGLFWYTMYCHGFTGVILLLAALLTLLGSTARARTPVALWAHVAIVIFSIEIFFYGLMPHVVFLGFAFGIAWRENHPVEAAELPS